MQECGRHLCDQLVGCCEVEGERGEEVEAGAGQEEVVEGGQADND